MKLAVALLLAVCVALPLALATSDAWDLPAARRIVAIGDLHGDLEAARSSLRLARVLDQNDHWSGGDTVVVQLGDILDRGDDELAILQLFERLQHEAAQAGGAVHVLNGNHEIMNARGDFRYVTAKGLVGFPVAEVSEAVRKECVPTHQMRAAALLAGSGEYVHLFADHPLVLKIGSNVFVHGGLSPTYAAKDIAQMNREAREYLRGEREEVPLDLIWPEGPLWNRDFGRETVTAPYCEQLSRSLEILGAKRMIIGHSVQEKGITSACAGKVWRVDVGMSKAYGGAVAVLEIPDNNEPHIHSLAEPEPVLTGAEAFWKKQYELHNAKIREPPVITQVVETAPEPVTTDATVVPTPEVVPTTGSHDHHHDEL